MEKVIAFIASVKEREEQLKIVLKAVYGQFDIIHIILNWYEKVPDWIRDLDNDAWIFCHLNPTNKNAHDSVWTFVEAENEISKLTGQENYYFILDDDLLYPQNYIDKLIESIEKYERRAVVTVHGANIRRPVESYLRSRSVVGYCDRLTEDKVVNMAGCGTTAFHSSTIKPTLLNFPVVFCRDLWFSILCAENNVSIVSIVRHLNWITALRTPGDSVWDATVRNEKLQRIKDRVLKQTLVPLL